MKHLKRLAATAALAFAGLLAHTATQAATVVVDVSGATSVNLLGESGNTVLLVNIGPNTLLTSLSWVLTLEAFAPSSLSEMQVSFGGFSGQNLVTFAPDGFGGVIDADGLGHYNGSLDINGLGMSVESDGMLRIEFSEGYKDFAPGVAEGRWVSGNLTFGVSAVPEPDGRVLALLGLVVLGLARRAGRG
jgi:hypothetical protein